PASQMQPGSAILCSGGDLPHSVQRVRLVVTRSTPVTSEALRAALLPLGLSFRGVAETPEHVVGDLFMSSDTHRPDRDYVGFAGAHSNGYVSVVVHETGSYWLPKPIALTFPAMSAREVYDRLYREILKQLRRPKTRPRKPRPGAKSTPMLCIQPVHRDAP